jgi:ZIP family zinc transporter
MESTAAAEEQRRGGGWWRVWALVPLVLLVGVVSAFAATGGSLVELVGVNPPPGDEFAIRRVVFEPGEIRIRVSNPQRQRLTIAVATVDDAIVPFEVDGPTTLKRLRSATITVPYDWVEDEPISVGITSSSGVQTTKQIDAAVETPTATPASALGYGLIGLLVGIVPVALGLAWLPSLRRADRRWISAFMALTAGLLTFLALDALAEALQLQAALPSALGGTGLVLLGVAASYLGLSFLSQRLSARGPRRQDTALSGAGLATLIAVGIGLHNLGEGLAIGSSFALGELTLGTYLIVGFMIHNVSEGLGIATPIADRAQASPARLAALALIAGAPAIAGAWLGGFLTDDVVGVVFFSIAVGAAAQVVIEVGRYVKARAPGGLTSGWVLGGFLAGIAVMYTTGLLAG